MNNSAKHRGPDDEGYMSITKQGFTELYGEDTYDKKSDMINLKNYRGNSFLAFGHRRLSIIDLTSAAHQPMCDRERMLCVTFNGEIYNYLEIKEELKQKGYKFYTTSDTEVLINSYKEWEEACVEHFNGMWAFALWDKKANKLFCSRDRLGAKPFYYFFTKGQFLFSSELKQICANQIVPRTLNEELLITQLMWGISDFSEETLIKDIKSLPGGCNISLCLDENQKKITDFKQYEYWDIQSESREDNDIEALFKTLQDGIHLRTRSDVPIGIMLSGGLDSSCLVAEVSEMYEKQGIERKKVNTYTTCFHNSEKTDERKYAAQVNEFCGTKQNFIYPEEEDTFSVLKKLVWHLDGDCCFNQIGGFLTLREIHKKGIKVLLNGQGSDEALFGYERYYAFFFSDLLKKKKFRKFLQEYTKAAKNSKLSLVELLKTYLYFNKSFIRKKRCKHRMKQYISRDTIQKFEENKEVYKYLFFDSLEKLQYNEIRKTQLTHILRYDDREYMAFSIESRVPFIDYRFLEQAVGIAPEKKIQNGYTKYLLRKYLNNKLPQEVVWRKDKMGWPSPIERWTSKFDNKQVLDLFENAKSKKYFNIEALKRLYKQAPASWPIEKFMVTELFIRLFDVQVEEG